LSGEPDQPFLAQVALQPGSDLRDGQPGRRADHEKADMILAMLAQSVADAPCVPSSAPPPAFDAGKLKEGRFTYDLTQDGKPAGQFVLTIRRAADGSVRLAGDAVGSDQHWETETSRSFEPRRAQLSLVRRSEPYHMELVYRAGSVTVTETTGSSPRARRSERQAAIGPATVDQRIDWASVMATALSPGQTAAYQVFDAATGSSALTVRAEHAGVMASPIGDRPAFRLEYQVCKRGLAEPYVVYATRETPRFMLREDLRGHEVSVLSRVEP
jgi:hypothetical protein